ncbi:actin, putative [Entamoeba invadens IP1]|uniref:Actin, putative n=2 Tax=Entamoeba invadens TaxID=33085 RepID=A0A0A1U015_ENTIV|nr:actin, putative [Entamoeba invadens IP1]ELP85811.1 actin, putative [Entamoeba invadens IP1]BAN40227.1 actin, putative [Entamoeba invadens]BAN42414.1 actin, putative [Entamoeba invadens]|eukprot:XP_004185157.1 actin, putative [Entamoeba invadens IP1]
MDHKITIIDNGSGFTKAGSYTDSLPTAVFPTLVGYTKTKEAFPGDFANFKSGVSLAEPIVRGQVKNWTDLEEVWQSVFDELDADPVDQKVLITEPTMTPFETRDRYEQIMFETFDVKGLDVQSQGLMSLYYDGKNSGVVVDCGYGLCQVVPIYENMVLEHATLRLELGGNDITEYLCKLLSERGHIMTTKNERKEVNTLKEAMCYVAFDYKEELTISGLSSELEKKYELVDGSVIDIGNEAFRCTEPFFQPSLIGKEMAGLPELVYNSIMSCGCDLRRDFYNTIVLCGGSSLFPGMKRRFAKELKRIAPANINVNISAGRTRNYSCWLGAKVFATLPKFNETCRTREDYFEKGAFTKKINANK